VDSFIAQLKEMAEKIGTNVGMQGATAALKSLRALFVSLRERVRRTPQSQHRTWGTKWDRELDGLVSDLAPAFALGQDTSLPVSIFRMQRQQDAQWRGIHGNLLVLQTWYHLWDQQRRTNPTPRTVDRLLRDIETLVSIALFTSWAGLEIEKWARDLSRDEFGYQQYKVTAQRFDLFLTNLESFLRNLPDEFTSTTTEQHRLFPRMSP